MRYSFSCLVLFALVLVSCQKEAEVLVFNNSEVDRIGEIVEICLCSLSDMDATQLVVRDEMGKKVPSQLLKIGGKTPRSLIFPVTMKAGTQNVYWVREERSNPSETSRHIVFSPEKNQLSWKNEQIAFQLTGTVLTTSQPQPFSTKEIVSTWGAGVFFPYLCDSLVGGNRFTRFRILDDGPLRSSFVLYYDSIPFESKTLKAELMITLDAKSNLNEGQLRFFGENTRRLRLATGLFQRDSINNTVGEAAFGFMGSIEKGGTGNCNRLYRGFVFSEQILEIREIKRHLAAICCYQSGKTFRYFFGATWDNAVSEKEKDWFGFLDSKRILVSEPLKIKILR